MPHLFAFFFLFIARSRPDKQARTRLWERIGSNRKGKKSLNDAIRSCAPCRRCVRFSYVCDNSCTDYIEFLLLGLHPNSQALCHIFFPMNGHCWCLIFYNYALSCIQPLPGLLQSAQRKFGFRKRDDGTLLNDVRQCLRQPLECTPCSED